MLIIKETITAKCQNGLLLWETTAKIHLGQCTKNMIENKKVRKPQCCSHTLDLPFHLKMFPIEPLNRLYSKRFCVDGYLNLLTHVL